MPISLEITPDNAQFLKSGYEARTEKELPVLSRWFDSSLLPEGSLKPADYLDIILYSKEQIGKENEAMGETNEHKDVDYDYGIISVKAQNVGFECPMQPITAMRNSLGKEYGGSGVPFDVEGYRKSVAYWEKHATIK